MEILPKDVIFDIFSRLPAKLVTRLKIVCKLWYDLIKNSYFIKLHLDRSIATQSNLHFVTKTPILHLADFDTFDNPIELDYPFKCPGYGGMTVVGSCHGLLCCWNYDSDKTLFLYNPTTQTHKMLPFLPISPPFEFRGSRFTFGFGYDGYSGDYKCVRILQASYDTSSLESEVMVYSMKADSWRRVQDLPYYLYYQAGKSAFVGGAIHWVGDNGNRVYVPILSFDLKDETFGSIPLPHSDDERGHVCMCVGVLDACLCLLDSDFEFYDVWILKEYGTPKSWMRLFSIKIREDFSHMERTVSFSITRNELFLSFFLYGTVKLDIKTTDFTTVSSVDFHVCEETWVCVENLVMLNDEYDDHVSEKNMEEKRARTRRTRRGRKEKIEGRPKLSRNDNIKR